MPPHIVRYPPIQCNTRERCDQLQIPAVPPAWRVPEGPDSLAAVPMGGGGAWPGFEATRPATHSDTSAAGAESAGGSGGPGCGTHGQRQGLAGLRGEAPPHTATQAPPVRRAPEGPEGQAAVPVGGGGAWPGFETTRRAKLAARTARGRAAAHGHTKQPGHAAGPDGAQNISGATSNKTARPGCRRARLRYPWAATGPGWASRRHTAPQAPPVRRAPEGRRARAGFEIDHSEPKARVWRSRGRAAAHERTKQPGHAAGPDGAQNTSGATKQPGPNTRKPRPADAGRGQPTQSGGKA